MEIIDTIHTKGLQNFKRQANPVDIDIKNDKLSTFAAQYINKGYSCRFIFESLLFSKSITNHIKTIFITYNGLNDEKTTIIHDDEYKTLSTVYLDEITNCRLVKGSSIWVGATFANENYPAEGSNFVSAFKSKSINHLTRFSFRLLDGKQQKMKFDNSELKVTQLGFRINSLK